jgi:hypothetical protein
MQAFCTIITSNYFPYAVTLYKSLINFNAEETLEVLICDEGSIQPASSGYPGIKITRLKDMYGFSITDSIFVKYANDPDALRWSMKPVFINYLLKKNLNKVIFVDCDIFFYNDYRFLFDLLDSNAILLTLHRTTRNPAISQDDFLAFFKYGMFNAGFIGVSETGIPAMQWWANACLFKNEINLAEGVYKDQRYLDALPVLFDSVHIIDHPGCNIAFWNQQESKRTMVNGKLLINNKFPVIFIHFTRKYIPELLEGNDPQILPLFRIYEKCFEESGYRLNEFIPGLPGYKAFTPLIRLKRKLLLRTRIKRWLFKLSQS